MTEVHHAITDATTASHERERVRAPRDAAPDAGDPGLERVDALVTETRLRNVLRVNAVVSGLSGVTMLLGAGLLAGLLGVATTPVRVVGLGLVGFASVLVVASGAASGHLVRLASVIAVADVAWVLGSALAIALALFELAGIVIVGGAAAAVAAFAGLEARLIRRLVAHGPRTGDRRPATEVIRVSRPLNASSDRVWAVVRDHELYGRLAPNLRGVETTAADGPGLARRCYDNSGRAWNESCTLWDEGRRFAVAVDTDDYPYPLTTMRGSWWVEPTENDRARVGMTFAFRPTPGLRGQLFVWVMHAAFPFVLRRILRGWRSSVGA